MLKDKQGLKNNCVNPKNIPKLKMQRNRAMLESAPTRLQDIR